MSDQIEKSDADKAADRVIEVLDHIYNDLALGLVFVVIANALLTIAIIQAMSSLVRR